MSVKFKLLAISRGLLLVLALIPFGVPAAAEAPIQPAVLAPTAAERHTSLEVVKDLIHDHYLHLTLNDKLSAKVLDRYLADLDPNRIHFLAKDVADFAPYRHRLDDALRRGDLDPAFAIFNRYHQRLIERLTYLNKQVAGGLSGMRFDQDDYLQTDRGEAPWPRTHAEQETLWYKRLKNDALNLQLAGKNMKEVAKILQTRYRNQLHRARQIDSEDVFQTYINALAHTYDPHTDYFNPRTSENFDINMSLSLEGIGAVLQNEDEMTKVVRLVPAGPADKSKLLKPTDRIIGVGQGKHGNIVDVVGWRLDDVVKLIRGPKKTVVRLEVIPGGAENDHQTKVIAITRDTVKLEDQSARKKIIKVERDHHTYKIGVITIPTFYLDYRAMQKGDPNFKSTTRDVKRLLEELKAEHVDGVVVDLRDNGGGSLQEVNSLIGLFIRTGPTVQIRDADGKVEVLGDSNPAVVYNGPLMVMVNRLSASASEIFAGAIQDYHRGLIVGGRTFGKGTVQSLRPLDHGQLKITQAKFYRISGASTQDRGVRPDIAFPVTYDNAEIGESSLPNALSWDTIRAVRHPVFRDLTPVLGVLRKDHAARVAHDPEFQYLVKRSEYIKKMDKQTKVSLRESTRLKERADLDKERLALENRRRVAKGEKPLKSLAELRKIDDAVEGALNSGADKKDDAPDPMLQEGARILTDAVALTSTRVAEH
jgi:carboxyl-terminal processing protease